MNRLMPGACTQAQTKKTGQQRQAGVRSRQTKCIVWTSYLTEAPVKLFKNGAVTAWRKHAARVTLAHNWTVQQRLWAVRTHP